jgi:hypothetical protein
MSSNPYQSPSAEVRDPVVELVVPDEVLKKIKHAWIAATISGSITLSVTVFAIFGNSILGFSAWELIDVAFIFGLAFGIYKKSRTCAVLMLIYFIGAKILIMLETGKPSGLIMAIVFIYYFAQGVAGTFEYHKLVREQKKTGYQ